MSDRRFLKDRRLLQIQCCGRHSVAPLRYITLKTEKSLTSAEANKGLTFLYRNTNESLPPGSLFLSNFQVAVKNVIPQLA